MPYSTLSQRRNARKKYDTESVNRSIENARLRVQDAGFDPGDTDKRNILERALNLPEDQNFLFDVLDVITRPQQAIAGGISATVQGEDPLQAAYRGFTGQEKFRGSDLAEDLGIDNKILQAIVGTGLDIGLDPLTYIPGGVIAKGLKGAGRAAAVPVKSAYQAVERASPALRTLREETIQPALERATDALGRGFVPGYKLEETLQGTTDPTIKNLLQQTENQTRFMTEESQKRIAEAAKAAGGIDTGADVGRVLEAPLQQAEKQYKLLDDTLTADPTKVRRLMDDRYAALRSGVSGREKTRIQKEIDQLKSNLENPIERVLERPARELPTAPGVNQAARELLRSNQELRQWALDNGVQVNELEGYMTHVLAAEERKRRKNLKAIPIDRGSFGGQPNKKILSQRKIPGSVEDINEQMRAAGRLKEGETFFEPNAFFATAIGQKRLIEYVNSVKFRQEVLTNPNFARKLEDYQAEFGDAIPNNAAVIDTNNYTFMKESDDVLEQAGIQTEEIGGQYVVTKSVKQALDRYKKLSDDEGINKFLNAFDTVQSFWKRANLFSVPYHLRNMIGAAFNNYVGGMSAANVVRYTKSAYDEVFNAYVRGEESDLFREFREQGLGSSGQLQIEFARRGQDPEKAIRETIQKRSKLDGTLPGRVKAELSELKNPLKIFETSRSFGDFNDQANRFALYKWAKDKGMSPEEAAQKVRTVQFDYTKLTPLEREGLTRLFPFYRWMRNNLPFQIKQFINDPRKYAAVNKLRLNAQEVVGLEEENLPDWMKENFAIPVSGEEGKGHYLGLNLPLSDLTKLTDVPELLTGAATPFAKLPAELAINRSLFTGKPIEEFEGQQQQYAIPENIFGIPLPGAGRDLGGLDATLAYILESLGGQPFRQPSKFFEKTEDQDTTFRDPALGISSLLKPFDAETSEFFQQREQLQKLMDLIDYIEQQTGVRPRGVNEIR